MKDRRIYKGEFLLSKFHGLGKFNESEKEYLYDDCPGAKGKAIVLKAVKEMEIVK